MSGQEDGLHYSKDLNAGISHDLILEMMQGKIKSYDDIQDFIYKENEKNIRRKLIGILFHPRQGE